MNYNFRCTQCGAEQEVEICIKDYDRLKNSQTCSKCGGVLKRVIEWKGIASSSNFNGWCGKSGSSTI
jgi:predicted nucleic acid-binding Zn ribbon protein